MVNGITRFVRERDDFVRVNYARLLRAALAVFTIAGLRGDANDDVANVVDAMFVAQYSVGARTW